MAYSVGAFDRTTYKIGIAWSDTFIPGAAGYRKVLKKNPKKNGHGLWASKTDTEVYYLLQADESRKGWHCKCSIVHFFVLSYTTRLNTKRMLRPYADSRSYR